MHPELLKSPWGINQRLRQEAPVFKDPLSGIYFISRYEDVVQMAMDHETFSSRMMSASRQLAATDDKEILAVMESGYPQVPTMLTEIESGVLFSVVSLSAACAIELPSSDRKRCH